MARYEPFAFAAQHRLRDDADAEHDQNERAEKLGRRFAARALSITRPRFRTRIIPISQISLRLRAFTEWSSLTLRRCQALGSRLSAAALSELAGSLVSVPS